MKQISSPREKESLSAQTESIDPHKSPKHFNFHDKFIPQAYIY